MGSKVNSFGGITLVEKLQNYIDRANKKLFPDKIWTPDEIMRQIRENGEIKLEESDYTKAKMVLYYMVYEEKSIESLYIQGHRDENAHRTFVLREHEAPLSPFLWKRATSK